MQYIILTDEFAQIVERVFTLRQKLDEEEEDEEEDADRNRRLHSVTLSDESKNRGLVCAHTHSIPRTQKILTFMS